MPIIHLETRITAPLDRCFDLARSVDLHLGSRSHTGERAIAGIVTGLMAAGDSVTWEARHFGLSWRMTSKITDYDPPARFADEQVNGPFAHFRHVHTFRSLDDSSTLMTDEFDFTAPLGPLGHIANRLFLTDYMRRLLVRRNLYLKRVAEESHVPHENGATSE